MTSPSSTSRPEPPYVVVSDPRPGTVVELPAGSRLAVRFRRRLGTSRWGLSAAPGHVVALEQDEHEFSFLVFDGPRSAGPVRFERRHPERDIAHEVCELHVVPVGGAGRTSTLASPRTA